MPYGNVDSLKPLYPPIPTTEKPMESKVLSDLIYITHLLCSRKEGVLRP